MNDIPLSRAGLMKARLWRLWLAMLRGTLTLVLLLVVFACAARGHLQRERQAAAQTGLGAVDELALMVSRDAAARSERGARRFSLSQPGRAWSVIEAVDAGWLTAEDAARVTVIATPEGPRVLPRPVRSGFAPTGGSR